MPLNEVKIKKRDLVFLDELIFERGRVSVDFDIAEFVLKSPEEFLDKNERLLSLYLKKLITINKVDCCKKELEKFLKGDFNPSEITPDFILLDFQSEDSEKLEKQLGIICIPSDFKISEKIIRVYLEVIKGQEKVSLDNIFKGLPKCNTLIIEDPYIFENDNNAFIKELISKVYNEEARFSNFPVTIIHKPIADKNSLEKVSELIKEIEHEFPKVVIELKNKVFDFHDRNIYSNSFWITCDYGFKKKYNSATKWVSFPLGIYYSEYLKRKKESTKYSESVNSLNYLVYQN
jgi:hypothetical protein